MSTRALLRRQAELKRKRTKIFWSSTVVGFLWRKGKGVRKKLYLGVILPFIIAMIVALLLLNKLFDQR